MATARDPEAADVEALRQVLARAAVLELAAEDRVDNGTEERQERDQPQRGRQLDVRDLAGEVGHLRIALVARGS
jgi:hypothetical protein